MFAKEAPAPAQRAELGPLSLHTPRAPAAIMVSAERAVEHLNRTLDSSLIASYAYQKWPT